MFLCEICLTLGLLSATDFGETFPYLIESQVTYQDTTVIRNHFMVLAISMIETCLIVTSRASVFD